MRAGPEETAERSKRWADGKASRGRTRWGRGRALSGFRQLRRLTKSPRKALRRLTRATGER